MQTFFKILGLIVTSYVFHLFGINAQNCNQTSIHEYCQNGGSCLNNTCLCSVGFTGTYCFVFLGCLAGGNYSCINGTCISSSYPPFCSCNIGFIGSTCNTKAIGCALKLENVCSNHGTCNNDTGICNCSSGFIGDECSLSSIAIGVCVSLTIVISIGSFIAYILYYRRQKAKQEIGETRANERKIRNNNDREIHIVQHNVQSSQNQVSNVATNGNINNNVIISTHYVTGAQLGEEAEIYSSIMNKGANLNHDYENVPNKASIIQKDIFKQTNLKVSFNNNEASSIDSVNRLANLQDGNSNILLQKYDVNGATAAIINDSKINVAKNESLNPEIIYSLLELVNKIKQAN